MTHTKTKLHNKADSICAHNIFIIIHLIIKVADQFDLEDLAHLPLDKIVTISPTTFSNEFIWMKSFVFCFEFHLTLSPWVQ